jgi:pilus assembly protein CpaB
MAGTRRALAPRLRDHVTELLHGPGWRRVALARRAAAALLATLALVLALAPGADAGGVPVVVAAHDLTAGSTLGAGDLAVRQWPAELLPAGAAPSVAAVDGRVLVGAARAGEPLTDVRLVGADPAAGLHGSPDAAAVPVRLADPDVAALLVPGSRVDVVTLGPRADDPVVLAADAAVLAVLPPAEGAGSRGRLVLVALPRAVATRVAAAALTEQVAITLR